MANKMFVNEKNVLKHTENKNIQKNNFILTRFFYQLLDSGTRKIKLTI